MKGQIKCGADNPFWTIQSRIHAPSLEGYQGPVLEPGLGTGPVGERLVAGSLLMEPVQAQPEMAAWVYPPVCPPPTGGARGVGCSVGRAAGKDGDFGVLTPGFANWLLEHGLSPLWWGRSRSWCERLRGTDRI